MKKLLLLGAALTMMLPLGAQARFRGGFYYGSGFGPYGWYSPFYGPYLYAPYAAPNAGEVKLDTKVKDAQVFLNGSLAGTAGKLKSFWLPTGTYHIEIREPGRPPFAQQIYVVPGKTLQLHPDPVEVR